MACLRLTREGHAPIAAIFLTALAISPAAGQTGASFVDNFDGSLNTTRWLISDGWANGDYQNCLWSANNLTLADGVLGLTLSDRPSGERNYSCSEIQSYQTFGYGTYEAMLRVPAASGSTGTFFTYIGPTQGQPHQEIDLEFLGRLPDTVQLNYYTNGVGGHEEVVPAPEAHTRFERYAFVWEPGHIRWYAGDQLLREVEGDDVPSIPQKIYFSLWASDTMTDWLGPFEYPGSPLVLSIDWMAFTAAGEPCQFPESIVCELESGQ